VIAASSNDSPQNEKPSGLKMIPHDRVGYLVRIDGLSSELLRLSLYSNQHLTASEATSYRTVVRMLSQWCDRMHDTKDED
jgi:hypothetical protein